MKLKMIAFLSLVSATMSANAIPLVTYTFTGSAGSEPSFAPEAQPANANASSMSRGTGLTPTSAVGAFSSSGWTLGSILDVNDYYTFSVSPDFGFGLTLTQLILDERRSSTGIRGWSVRSSLDSFASDLATFSVNDDELIRSGQTINLSTLPANLTSLVEFRIYGYSAESSGGTWRIDNVKLEGTVQSLASVPDTGATALLLLAPVLGIFIVRRSCICFS